MEIDGVFWYTSERGDVMNCSEIESQIGAFLDNDIKGRRLSRFLEHMETCEACKEELTIQYLCMEGIARLEEGQTFDLERELNEYIHGMYKKQKKRMRIKLTIAVLELLAIIAIIAVFIYALI